MVKFFRRIRQKLFTENKFTKYLIYAIGEIFLVVIGILIALQVNNYNEDRKSDVKERKYLISMKNELINNFEIVKTETEGLDKSINAQRQLITLINSDKDTISEIDLSRVLAMSFSNVFELGYQDGIFKELLYSGGLIFIDNDSIKNEVTSWEGRMIEVLKQEKGVYDAREKIIDYIIEYGGFKNMIDDIGVSDHYKLKQSIKRNSNKVLLKSRKFENLLSYHIALNESLKSYYINLEKEINNLLRIVKGELSK